MALVRTAYEELAGEPAPVGVAPPREVRSRTQAEDTLLAIVEQSTGILHTWTNAKFLGRPKIDRLKGIVTGITGQVPVGGYLQTLAP